MARIEIDLCFKFRKQKRYLQQPYRVRNRSRWCRRAEVTGEAVRWSAGTTIPLPFFRKFHPIFLCLLGQQLTKTPHKCCTFGRNSETPRGRKSLAHTHARTISTGTVPLKRSGKTRDDGETPFFFLFQKKTTNAKTQLDSSLENSFCQFFNFDSSDSL